MLDTEYERRLRQALCIFPALTSGAAAVIAALWSFNENRLHYHFDTVQETVFLPLLLLVIFGGFTVAEMYSKTVFIFREVIRFIIGSGALLYAAIMMIPNPGVLMSVLLIGGAVASPFILPLLIYWHKTKKKKQQELKEFMEKIHKEEQNGPET
ncbi:MAG: hypothetical protein IJ071_05965 [Ruminococcus sp.]|nr:hypothetical protein [Ruminococcus sp.]